MLDIQFFFFKYDSFDFTKTVVLPFIPPYVHAQDTKNK